MGSGRALPRANGPGGPARLRLIGVLTIVRHLTIPGCPEPEAGRGPRRAPAADRVSNRVSNRVTTG